MFALLLVLFFNIILIGAFSGAEMALAQSTDAFIPLVGIPYVQGDKVATFGDYVNALYFASISIAAFLAVIKIIFAGVKYMLSDVITSKEDAKKDIKGALLGLLIVIGAVLVLNTINPSLSRINLFADAPVPPIGLSGTTYSSSDTAAYLKPKANETLTILPCDTTTVTPDCNAAADTCRTEHSGYLRTDTMARTSLYCYTVKDTVTTGNTESTCNGYFDAQTKTCYANDNSASTIDLGDNFINQTPTIRETECKRLGGRRYEQGVCYL